MIAEDDAPARGAAVDREIEKHYRHNFIVNVLDGTNFWLGYSFIAPGVILPLYVSHFTVNPLIIGLVAVISSTGYFLPQLLTANWVEQLPLKKIVPINLGFFLERMPIFLMAPSAFLVFRSPSLALLLFMVLFSWHSFGAGTVAVAWQDMIAKVIPLDWRGRFMGITNFGGTATGVAGAVAAAWLLNRYVFPYGYIACFGVASVFIFISWVFLALNREPPVMTRQAAVSRQEYWRKLPAILRGDHNFRRFIFSQAVINLGGMAWGFMAVYATQKWGLSDGTVSGYTAAMLIGQAVANPFFGMIADRKGYKLVIETSIILAVLSLLLTVIAPYQQWFYLVFVLRGASAAGTMLAILFVLEFSAPAQRPTYIGLSNSIAGIASGIAPIAGGWLADMAGYSWLFIAAIAACILGYACFHWLVKDPRRA